ncbi:asparagine synthase (glutamine-hydrolyzing) [Sphingomonas sp.]|uniref:asparagine synthase (glutamine-hydrolyzing) n=1 Tax=Sphingomonas sp. TaxID=28214 RepID=UPI003B005618
MCGIAGFISANASGDPKAILRRMTTGIRHRGPDDAGLWLEPHHGVALGHRRLSILDLSTAGHQPMASAQDRYQLVYNGEIYNHRLLRRELDEAGRAPNWRGHSDTEVILAAFEAWGIETALQRFNGMFALAVWDRKREVLTLACDRFGEKPLYFGWQQGKLLFASEMKALYAHPDFSGTINRDALTLYLRHNYIPAPHSIWEGISKLEPGHYVEIRPLVTSASPKAYWSLLETITHAKANPLPDTTEVVDQLDALLLDAVGLRMDADVPVGAFLSGGIDSSLITALMQAQSTRPVKTFTIGFDDPRFNEADHAKAIATHLGTEHTELIARPQDALDTLPRLPAIWDEPFSDSSQIPTLLVSALTRQHVTVSLSGDAGDEIFGGYNRYVHADRLRSLTQPIPLPLRRAVAAGLESPVTEKALHAIRPLLPERYRRIHLYGRLGKVAEVLRCSTPEELYRRLVSHDIEPEAMALGGREPAGITGIPRPAFTDFRETMMYLDTLSYLPGDILTKVDRASMAVSLESRIPFLDPRVVEFAWRLPLSTKLKDGVGKHILRQVLYRYVPQSLIDRPKMGFGVPLGAWLTGPLREWRHTLLDPTRIAAEGYFAPARVEDLQREIDHGASSTTSYRVWDIMMFQAWLDEHRAAIAITKRAS